MSERRKKPFYIIVAFRYDQKNSILYRNSPNPQTIADNVFRALLMGNADVISIRKVYEICPVPEKPT